MQTQAKKEKTAVIEKPTFSVASIIDQYGDAGLENVTANQMAMPFIKLISDASYERRPGHEKHIEGAHRSSFTNDVIHVSVIDFGNLWIYSNHGGSSIYHTIVQSILQALTRFEGGVGFISERKLG